MSLDSLAIREQFPQLGQLAHGKPLVYLDNAATTLKPQVVINRLADYYSSEVSNVHRGAHYFSNKGTDSYEQARKYLASFINARSDSEIVYTRGTTESINLVADCLTRSMEKGSEILLTEMEHHSNLVPWQAFAKNRGLNLRFLSVDDRGELDLSKLEQQLNERTSVVSVVWTSNALGTENQIDRLISRARQVGAKVLIDAAQTVTIRKIDVQALDCDFLVFSGHKIFGPTGIGVLYGKEKQLNLMPPYQLGGSMISEVDLSESTYLSSPQRFEAGTPHIAGALGLDAAIRFFEQFDLDAIVAYEKNLLKMFEDGASEIKGLRWIGESPSKVNIGSFVIEKIHPSDIGQLLDQQGIAVRTGHHCTQPLMKKFGIPGTVRVSFSIYNDESDVQNLVQGLEKAREMLT